MELEEAKEFIKKSWLFDTANENIGLKEAISTVLQELDRLQKENEELKEIDLTTVHIKGVCDEKERWRNKIREKIEAEKKIVKTYYGGIKYQEGKIAGLKDLLKEE